MLLAQSTGFEPLLGGMLRDALPPEARLSRLTAQVLQQVVFKFENVEPLAKRRKADRLRVVGDRRRGALSLHVIT